MHYTTRIKFMITVPQQDRIIHHHHCEYFIFPEQDKALAFAQAFQHSAEATFVEVTDDDGVVLFIWDKSLLPGGIL